MGKSRLDRFRQFVRSHRFCMWLWNVLLCRFGKLSLFWRRPRLTNDDIDRCYRALSGVKFAILGLGSRRFVTGLFLPRGNHDVEHTAIYIGDGIAVEAVTPRCRAISLRRLLRQYDNVTIVCYPPIVDSSFARKTAIRSIDRPYDTLFDGGRRELYCHEFGALCLAESGIKLPKSGDFVLFDDLAAAGQVILEIRR